MTGVIQTIAVAALLALGLANLPGWAERLPYLTMIPMGLVLGYAIRNTLVDHLATTRHVMYPAAMILIGGSILYAKGIIPAVPYGSLLIIAATCCYMGCYFWLMSDPRIVRES
uniref:Uncharacterized protein n=1 Tax=Schlesneria paludicola TaxID=360056 RepID=A0A7C2NYK9_9PLAN